MEPVEWLNSIIGTLEGLIDQCQELNNDPAVRCRELSLAITNIEQGYHWLTVVPNLVEG